MRSRIVSLLLASALAALSIGIAAAGTADITVEGGAYFDYVAPDPSGPTDGAIRFGFDGDLETIAADAELVPPADTNLAFLGSGTPTCLEVTREGGTITRIAFVPSCEVAGQVELVEDIFGPDVDAYLIAGRVATPVELVETDPALAALIGTAADNGGTLSITFHLDEDGVPVSFEAVTSASGPVTIGGTGDITVGAATLPSAVIDDASRAALTEAAALGVDAQVLIEGDGVLGQKGQPEVTITLTVTYSAPTPVATPTPTPAGSLLPDTSATQAARTSVGAGWMLVVAAFVVAGISAVAVRVRR